MKSIIRVLVLFVIILSMSACVSLTPGEQADNSSDHLTETDNKGAEEMVLTERQQSILEKQNLPTTFEDLNESQKKAIIAIEEMFCYLDETYDVSFEYLGYRPESAIDKETLIVYPSDGVSADSVSVVRVDGVCTDDYANLYYRDNYELMLRSYFEQSAAHVEVFSDIAEVVLPCDENNLRASISATSGIYLVGNEGFDLDQLAHEFGDWYAGESNGISCSFSIYLVSEDTYWSLTRYNRTNYDESVISRINITVRSDGTVIVR